MVWSAPDGDRQTFECIRCDFVFIWPRHEQDFSALPEEAYYGNWEQLDLSGAGFIFNEVSAAVGRRIAQGRLGSSEPPAILDAGCGAGHLLLDFRAHGWNVRGVDPWAAVAAAGRKYYRLPIETARMETAAVEPASQDAILAIDVLQFIADPASFLKACHRALRPGGLLYLNVPNFASDESRRDGWRSRYFIPSSYLSYFTTASIRRLLESTGFNRLKVRSFGGPKEDLFLRVLAYRVADTQLTWELLADEVKDGDLPPLDRISIDETKLSARQRIFREHGYLIIPGFIPDALIERYCAVREKVDRRDGWTSATPYLTVPEIRDLCLYRPLTDLLEELIGQPMALHLNLTGWVSTERDWHQDDYLNPPQVNGHYVAVWTALDRIAPDAGPFEFVPDSHRWPIIRQRKVLELLGYSDHDEPSWPWESERLLTPFFEREIKNRGARVERFLSDRGDVLIWHARLLHRGSLPERPNAERRSMIAHYSAVARRMDMPKVVRHPGGGLYFLLES